MAKNLSKTGFKVKIEQSYADVVTSEVGPNWYSGGSPRDLVKDFPKVTPQPKNPKISKWRPDMVL